MKACRKCHFLTDQNACPRCGGSVSRDWQGYCIILDYRKSQLARKMNIDNNGRYALKVR